VRRRGAGATDRWGWAAMEPDGQRWGAGESERERARRRGSGLRHVGLASTVNSTIFTDSNGFKNLQTLTDSKSTFPYSKNLK
jgi:hypothetical protein